MQFGEFVQERLGSGLSGQDAANRRQGEGAEADRTRESRAHIVALIMRDQRQQALSLQFALDLLGEQAIEELHGDGAEFAEALAQEQGTLVRIAGRMMSLEFLPCPGRRAGHQPMPGDFVQADRVDDDFALGDTDRQHLADVRPRHRIEVQAMGDIALDVDVAINDQGGVEVAGWQRQ